MNFLAHAYLSGSSQDILIGNFIADSIRGKEIQNFRKGIVEGIQLHRKIDAYTDSHPIVSNTKSILRPHFGRYSSVVSDLYFDHFLALYWTDYSSVPLKEFTQQIYQIIEAELHELPPAVNQFFPYMVKHDWLFNYQYMEGMHGVFRGMSKRASFDSKMEFGVDVLKYHYTELENDFRLFFPDLIEFVELQSDGIE